MKQQLAVLCSTSGPDDEISKLLVIIVNEHYKLFLQLFNHRLSFMIIHVSQLFFSLFHSLHLFSTFPLAEMQNNFNMITSKTLLVKYYLKDVFQNQIHSVKLLWSPLCFPPSLPLFISPSSPLLSFPLLISPLSSFLPHS